MPKVVLKPKITERGIHLNTLESPLGSMELASVSAKALNGVVHVSIVPRRLVCIHCREEIDGKRPPTICFSIAGNKALGYSTTLLHSAEDKERQPYEVCLHLGEYLPSDAWPRSPFSCQRCGFNSDPFYTGIMTLTRRGARLLALALMRSAVEAMDQAEAQQRDQKMTRDFHRSLTIGIATFSLVALAALVAAAWINVPAVYESWRTEFIIFVALALGLALGIPPFYWYAVKRGWKSLLGAHVFALGSSLAPPAIMYAVLLWCPVSSLTALKASVSFLALGFFFDFWQWSKGSIEQLLPSPPPVASLRPRLRIRQLLFQAVILLIGPLMMLDARHSVIGLLFGALWMVVSGISLIKSYRQKEPSA